MVSVRVVALSLWRKCTSTHKTVSLSKWQLGITMSQRCHRAHVDIGGIAGQRHSSTISTLWWLCCCTVRDCLFVSENTCLSRSWPSYCIWWSFPYPPPAGTLLVAWSKALTLCTHTHTHTHTRSTCVRRQPQLRIGGFCWSKVLLPTPTCAWWCHSD